MRHQLATDLAVPIVDTDGRQLRLAVGPTPHIAVASKTILFETATVHLDVLAASHRVRFVTPDGSEIIETVACDVATSVGDALPPEDRWCVGDWIMDFRSSVCDGLTAVEAASAAVEQLDADRSIVARFPGHDHAFTAIELSPARTSSSVAWRTWHLYPGADPHVVCTTTTATSSASFISSDETPSTDLQGVS